MRQAGEHDAAARAHQRQRVADGLGGAGRLEHDINALAAGERARRLLERRLRHRARHLGAQLAGQREAPRRAAHHQHARAATAQDLHGEQPQRTGADHGGAGAGLDLGARHGADDDGERLGDHQILVGHAGRGRPAAALGHPHGLGKAAVHVDADGGARQAQVAVALAAEWAPAARVVRLDGDAVPHPDTGDGEAGLHHGADELVTEHARVADAPVAGPDPVVGSAQPGHGDLDHHVARARCGHARVLHTEVVRGVEDGGFHDTSASADSTKRRVSATAHSAWARVNTCAGTPPGSPFG